MHRISVAILFIALFIFKADSTVSSRGKPLHDNAKEVANDVELKSQDKTKDCHQRVARTLDAGRVIDTFSPWNQERPRTELMKQSEEHLVEVDKSVDGPMPIYDDDVDKEAVDPLQGLLPQKYWDERDDQQQASLINDFFRKNVHNQKTPIFNGNDNNNLRREFVSNAGNNKDLINNGKPENKLNPVGGNFRKPDVQYHGEENFSPSLLVTDGRKQSLNLNNGYSSVPVNEYSPPEYDKVSSVQIADPLMGGEHSSAGSGGNAESGFVFYSEPRRATDVSPLNSNLANGIGKIVDTIMKDVIVNNLKNDQQKASPSLSPSGNNEAEELVFTSLVEKAIPPREAPPLESVFSLNAAGGSSKPDAGQTGVQERFTTGRKLLFFNNNNKDKKYPMPVKTKANKMSLLNQSKEAKKENGNSLNLSLQKLQSAASNRTQLNELNRLYKNPSHNYRVFNSGNPSAKEITKNDKEKLSRLKNLHDYQKYLNLVKNLNRADEEIKNQNNLPSPKVESATIKQNDNNQDKENILQRIEQVNYLLDMQHREDEKKNKNGSFGVLHTSHPHIEYKIDDYASKLKQQQEANHQSTLPDDNNKINEDHNKYKLEPHQDKNSQPALPNVENKLKYPLNQSKSGQISLPAPAYDKVMLPNSIGSPPSEPITGTDQNGNELLQHIMKQVNENPPTQPEHTDANNAYKMNKPDTDRSQQPTDGDNDNAYKLPDSEQNDQPDTQTLLKGDLPYDTTATSPNQNDADPALMIEEINKFILERKAKLESLSEFIAKLRLKKLQEMSTRSNAAFSKNRRQVNELELEKDDKDFLNNENNDKNGDNSVRFSDEDGGENNRGHFLTEDQNLNENVGLLGSNKTVTSTPANTTSSAQQTTDKQTIINGSQIQYNNSTTVSNNQTTSTNNIGTVQATSASPTMTTTTKNKTSGPSVPPPSSVVLNRPQVSDEELEALNINMSNKIVDRIFQQADQTENMRANLGLCRKSDSVKTLKASEKVLPETEAVLRQVLECIRGLIKYQLEKQTCSVLDSELYEFLKWMLLTGEAKHGEDYMTRRRKHGSVKTDFLFHNECDTTTPCDRTSADTNTDNSSNNKLNSGLHHRIFVK